MKALATLPQSMSAREVLRTGSERVAASRRRVAMTTAGSLGSDGVLRVVHPTLGISCPCASPEVAARLTEFLSR